MVEIPRYAFGLDWEVGDEFTPQEAWLDLIQLANPTGVIEVISFTDRWKWTREMVGAFFKALEKKGHIRAHDATRWCIMFQAQEATLQDEYEHCWRIYPKPVAKQKGYHAYAATRKGSRKNAIPVTARILYAATQRYATARNGEDAEFIMNPATFFGPDERWKEKPKPRTNSETKGRGQWKKPTGRDLTKTPGAQTKGRSPSTKSPPRKKAPPKKKTPRKKDPLGEL